MESILATRKRTIGLAILLGASLAAAAFFAFWDDGVAPVGGDLSALESSFVAGRCQKAEAVDRWLLQQSWFHDPAFTRLAGGFGQTSFSIYGLRTPSDVTEGAFCINGTDLMVRYFKRRLVPEGISLGPLSVSFGVRLRPLGEDIYSVRELTKDKMVLVFASDGREHVFYRKN